jgi:two-component system sensor histidine kinase BarA
MNLLSNAIKFSKVDQEIKVKVKYEQVDKDNVFVDVHVIDKGIGINEEDQLNLFKAHFVTSDEESKKLNQQSHGIGLSICDKISNALGGTLSVQSELGKGSTFTYRFKCEVVEVLTIDLESIRDKLHRE